MLSTLFVALLVNAVAAKQQAPRNNSLIVYDTPQMVRPYVLPKGYGISQGYGDTWNIYPVTGNSSGGAFCLMITNGPGAPGSGVFPHVHKKTHENFYASKGRVQLWGQNLDSFIANRSEQQTRVLSQGDIGSIPPNTIHTFQLIDPDTSLTGVLVPGGFEEFFFTSATDPSQMFNLSNLPKWDVYPQLNFSARQDAVNGVAGAGNWHNGSNTAADSVSAPRFVAKNYGPKYLNSEFGYYQLITPLVTGPGSNNRFTQGTITMSPKLSNETAALTSTPQHLAFLMEEGMLYVTINGESAHLIDGDVVFVPANTTFSYFAEVPFTKFMYVSAGADGLDTQLLKNSIAWESAFYPTQNAHSRRDQRSQMHEGTVLGNTVGGRI
ncbi:RmlC-like cupin [Stipitochalara longipes BDJ]|nr:RmlC-like cupin [Stipitochalara longipes BDJ]